MEWPPQSRDLNIIEYLWCVLEQQVRNRNPLPSCQKWLEKELMEEWLKIPLDEVRKLYDSIHRRIEAVQRLEEDQLHINPIRPTVSFNSIICNVPQERLWAVWS